MDSKRGSISFYLIATIVLMVSSLIGAFVLIKKNQDNRNLAQSTCSDSTRQACDKFFTDDPSRGKCTSIGQKECRWFNGANATYTCQEISSYCTGCSIGTWILTDPLNCAGPPNGSPPPDNCGWNGSSWNKIPLGDQCYAVRYHCPTMTSSLASGGCNPQAPGGKEQGPAYKVYRTSADGTPSFDPSQCGVQQLDSIGACGCIPNYHSIYYPCASPTPVLPNTPVLTSTPIPTNTPTPKPTSTPRPTSTPTATPTPTNTPIPSNTPTGTPAPTNTPTNVPGPTNTPVSIAASTSIPISTEVLAQGPSPTRIVLPQTGLDFPLQALTIIGVIITLAGFLILL